MENRPRPLVGISSCLLGQKVRYDGRHKRQAWLTETLGKFVSYVPICPEMEMGLGAPRESMRLTGSAAIRLVTNETNKDLTHLANSTARRILAGLPDLDGYLFKKNSPSCGLAGVPVDNGSTLVRSGRGIFAARLLERFPDLPVLEEDALADPETKEQFVIRVFGYRRWKEVPARVTDIQAFHQHYKLLLLAHSPRHYRELGKIAANPAKRKAFELHRDYGRAFHEALAVPSSRGKRANVLEHVLGYFKRELTSREKKTFGKAVDDYRRGKRSLLAVSGEIRRLLRRQPVPYLEGQLFFEPYPRELRLRRYL